MPQNLTDDKSTLIQVMAWCRQATSHYRIQCWPRSPTPYGVTRPQWVNSLNCCTIWQIYSWINWSINIVDDFLLFSLNISRHINNIKWCDYSIRSTDNNSTGFWPTGSLHTLGADGHIQQKDRLFVWIKILCIEYILWGIPTIESTFDVANMVKTATVKDVPMNNDAHLNIQAC